MAALIFGELSDKSLSYTYGLSLTYNLLPMTYYLARGYALCALPQW